MPLSPTERWGYLFNVLFPPRLPYTFSMPRVSKDKLSVKIRAIADPHRRQILHMLADKGKNSLDKPTGLCASDIEARLKISQPTISHHMRILTEAGLVTSERFGQWMLYRRNEAELRSLGKELKAL